MPGCEGEVDEGVGHCDGMPLRMRLELGCYDTTVRYWEDARKGKRAEERVWEG